MTPEEARKKGSALVGALVPSLVEITVPMGAAERLEFWMGFLHSIRGCATADVGPQQAVTIYKDLASSAARAARKKRPN